MEVVEDGSVYQVGTYNGNSLSMAAARASLEQVLTPEAYRHLEALNERIVSGCEAVIERYQLPATPLASPRRLRHLLDRAHRRLRDLQANQDVAVTELAWLWNMNRGVYMTPGREEEWTCRSLTPTRRSTTTSPPSTRWRQRSSPEGSTPAVRKHPPEAPLTTAAGSRRGARRANAGR